MEVDDLKKFSSEINSTPRIDDLDHTKLICDWGLEKFDMPTLRRMWNHFRMNNALCIENYGSIVRPCLTSSEEEWYNQWELDNIFCDFIKLDRGGSLFLCFCTEDGTEYIIKKCLDTENFIGPDGSRSKFIIIVDETYKKASKPRNSITAKAHGYGGQFILTCIHADQRVSVVDITDESTPSAPQ